MGKPAARHVTVGMAYVLAMLALAACGNASAHVRALPRRSQHSQASSAVSPTPAPSCPVMVAAGFSCVMQRRMADAEKYLANAPGEVGIVLRDRSDGAVWRNADAATEFPTASTIKLAMVVDLLVRNQSGQIQLSGPDWDLMYDMLNYSDDGAADTLWSEYEDDSFLGRINGYGMPNAEFSEDPPYWGYIYCTPDDLDGLINYVLGNMAAGMRRYIVSNLRRVAPDQQFGVWGAGPSKQPGNKDGWEDDDGIWIVDSVGFAGPDERYTLAMMDDLQGNGTFSDGADTLTQVASLLFHAHLTAEPTVQATP